MSKRRAESIVFMSAILTVLLHEVSFSVDSGLSIRSSINAQFLVVDPLGRKTGFDGSTGMTYINIPSSNYDILPSENLDSTISSSDSWECTLGGSDVMLYGHYWVKVYCQQAGNYWVEMRVTRDTDYVPLRVSGIAAAGQTFMYGFLYDTNPAVPISYVTRSATGELEGSMSIRSEPVRYR